MIVIGIAAGEPLSHSYLGTVMPSATISSRLQAMLLLAVVVLACAGSAVWQGVRTTHYHWVRAEGARRVRDTIVVTTTSKTTWLTKDELRYEGRMFDVTTRKKVCEGWMLIGHYDEADDGIFDVLQRLYEDDPSERKDGVRLCVFLPEALLPSIAQRTTVQVLSPRLLYAHEPGERWTTTCPAAPRVPPEWGRI